MTLGQTPLISIVVVSFNMARELERVLLTLTPPYQQGFKRGEIEVIVVDNGSLIPPDPATLPESVTLVTVEYPTVSPVHAVNLGLRAARANLIGVLIDGARMASPGLCRYALLAARLHKRPVISTLGFHLGQEVQMKSVEKGYCQAVEDRLLASINWQENGYQLFNISVFAGSSQNGWFMPIAESNALFLTKELWDELDGYDERFNAPGGGLVNLDAYVRACELLDSELITLLSEGTFHQVHGGIATNQKSPQASWEVFHREYMSIREKTFVVPERSPLYLGTISPQVFNSIKISGEMLLNSLS